MCVFDNCDNPEHARGMCKKHYMRQRYKTKPSYKKAALARSGKANPTFTLNEFETINKIPEIVLFKRFKKLDNLITL